jgi:hypothetical protein
MRKNLAGAAPNFHIATSTSLPSVTCPQFLWINLCGIAFPYGKSLIFIKEISPLKILAAPPRMCSLCILPTVHSDFSTFFVDKIVRKRTYAA